MHQAEVALLDEVEQREARRLVLLGDRDHEAQVGLHEVALGLVAAVHGALERLLATRGDLDLLVGLGRLELGFGLAALFDRLGEVDFVVLGEKGVLANVGEVETYEVFIVTIYAVFRHGFLFSSAIRRLVAPATTSYTEVGNLAGKPKLSAYPARLRGESAKRPSRLLPARHPRSGPGLSATSPTATNLGQHDA